MTTTKKFKSLQEPKEIWVVMYWNFHAEKWLLDFDILASCKGNAVYQLEKSGSYCTDYIHLDGSLKMELFRFRRYVPAPARKTRKK